MSMASAGCRLTPRLQRMFSSTFASWKMRMKRGNSRKSSTLPRISVGKRCGNFRYRYDYKAGHRICLEVSQNCPQCQLGSDYGHCQKTTGAIQSQGPWDTLSIDIVGPLPADHLFAVHHPCPV